MKRGGPLTRKTPLRTKATMKRVTLRAKSKPAPPAVERRHMARVAALPCLVCGGRSTVHHVTAPITGGRIARSDRRVVPLCPAHHQIQHGPRESVEALGHAGFHREHGIDLLAVSDRLWAESQVLEEDGR